MILKKLICLLCVALIGTSCGYLSEEPLESKETYSADSSMGGCDIDADAFANILEEDIDSAIQCLEDSFNQFQEGIRRPNQDSIDRDHITRFINKFFESNRDSIVDALGLLFKVNMLILKDRPDSLSTENIANIAKLLRVTNRSAIKLTNIIDTMNTRDTVLPATYEESRIEFSNVVTEFTSSVLSIVTGTISEKGNVNIISFLEELEETTGKDLKLDQVKNFLGIKVLLVGGSEEILTTNEVDLFLKKLPALASIGFDAYYLDESFFSNGKRGLFDRYSKLLVDFQDQVSEQSKAKTLITKENLLDAIEKLADSNDFIETDVAQELIEAAWAIKKHVFSDNDGVFTFGDFDKAVFFGKVALEAMSGYFDIDTLIEESDEDEYWNTRVKVKDILGLTSDNILNIISNRDVEINKFDLQTMAEETFEHLRNVHDLEIDLNYNLVEAMVPIKKLIVGGTERDFNIDQLNTLISKLPTLGQLAFDLSQYAIENFESDKHKAAFLLEQIKTVKTQLYIYENPEAELIYTDETIISLLNEFMKDEDDYEDSLDFGKFADSIASAKTKFIGGSADRYTVKTFQTVISYAEQIAGQSYYNEIAWELNRKIIKKNKQIKKHQVKMLDTKDAPLLNKYQVSLYGKEFRDLLINLRLYRTDDGKQIYSHEIKRTKYGLNESSIARFGIKKLLGAYCTNAGRDPYKCGVTAEELNTFLNDFKSLLVEFNLWSPNIESFANNCLYLADLFQTKSNGDMRIGLDEGIDYANLILSAVQMGTDVMDALGENDLCENLTTGTDKEIEEEPTYGLECYRDNFFDVFLNKLGYRHQLKSFAKFYDNSSKKTRRDYLMYVEQFVRDTPENEFMRLRDITLLIGAIQNIESMILRFDTNKSNVLEPHETNKAFEVYRNIVIEQGGLTGWKKKFAKSAFLYMVKEMKFPTPGEVMKYHMNPFASKDVTARRINVASILYYFATL